MIHSVISPIISLFGLVVSFGISSNLSSVFMHSFEARIFHLHFSEFHTCLSFVRVTPLYVLSILYACGCLLKSEDIHL